MTLPLVVTSDPETGVHNLGMYRSQVFGLTKSAFTGRNISMGRTMLRHQMIACQLRFVLGGPPQVIFSAISPLPDNLSEYEFAGLLSGRRLKITKCLTRGPWVPADCDFVIEGYTIPSEKGSRGHSEITSATTRWKMSIQ